ncbi:P-loop containing nucleoside triphosphate hydrolase protein, partial [Amanita rubescens]
MDFEWSEEMANRMKSVFGIEKFRHCQRGVCNAVMDKRDVVCVMPTGGGKSLTYQLPALVQTGCTLVISPLLALIADQVFHLVEAGIEAVRYTGATPEHERQRIYNRLYAMADGTLSEGQKEIKLCYVTPEMILRSSKFKRMLSYLFENARIVLDEAHCVSELGHDFRKDYGQLGILRTCYPNVPILALSATCPPRVLNDVLHTLNMKSIIEHNDPRRTLYFSSPLYRKNLHYEILPKPEVQREAIGGIVKYILEKHPHDSGIIYCLRQKDSETVAKELQTMSMGKIRADVYHADLPDAHKENLHIEWRRGNIKVVCATIAFGLGIDKADVRFVLHFSKSIECYYQESGRAGRDGKDSDCILYYRPQDCMSLFAMVDSQRDGRDKGASQSTAKFGDNLSSRTVLAMIRYFSVATQLHKSSWTTDDLDASQPCGHCDNCKRPPENVETRDVTEDAWKLMKVLKAVQNQPMTLKRLTSLARGNSGGTYDIPGGGKGKI